MIRCIPLFLIFVFTLCNSPYLQAQHPDFTHNIWPTNHLEVEFDQEVSAYESYLRIEFQNNASNRINNRSDFTHKLDSILYWNQEGLIEVNSGKSEYLFQYGDELTDVEIYYIEKENDVFNSFPSSFTVTDYTIRNLIKKHTFTNNPISKDTFDHSTAFTNREYTYNENDQLILYEDQNQIALDNNRLTNRKIYHYDSLGLAKGVSHYFWYPNDDTITHVRETIYNHNDQVQLESIVNIRYDFEVEWINSDSTYLFYNTEDKVIEQTKFHWTIDNIFEPFEKSIYSFDENSNINREMVRWQFDQVEKVFRFKTIYDSEFYEYGSLKKRASFDSLSFEMPKEDNQTWSYRHNEQIHSDETMIPRYMNYEESREHNEIYVLEEYENYSGLGYYSYGLKLESRQQYFYSEIDGVSTDDPIKANPSNLKVSPNPVVDNLRFEALDYSGNVDIIAYDIKGLMVLKKQMVNRGDVDVSFLPSGVYFYTVRAGDKLLSGRFLKN